MKKVVYVGLDVHADSIVVGKCSGDEPAVFDVKLPNDMPALLRRLDKLGSRKNLIVCYEAGPTGFGLARRLTKEGIYCEVVAPSLIPKRQGAKIKTDRRDAANLARLLRVGELTPINLPTEETEAIRDLERAREDAVYRQNRIRNQLSKFLLRHGLRFEAGKTPWTGGEGCQKPLFSRSEWSVEQRRTFGFRRLQIIVIRTPYLIGSWRRWHPSGMQRQGRS